MGKGGRKKRETEGRENGKREKMEVDREGGKRESN